MGALYLLRHGETEWSKAGRHTGRTDVPLTAYGEQQARAAGRLLAGHRFALVLTSPLQRARRTAELAGLAGAEVDPDLVEWDYGGFEGRTTAEIRADGRPGWLVFRDGVVPGSGPGATPGESLAELAARVGRVVERARPRLVEGDVALVAHGHALRVLATVWLDQPPLLAQQLLLEAASLSVLDEEHDVPAIRSWSVSASALGLLPDGDVAG